MAPDLSVLLSRFAAGRYRPATFLERGVALPFTTPDLLGGRIRPGDRRAPELVLANPAGAEGVYVLPWGALPDFCPPSLHDRALWSGVSALQILTPASIRAVARRVALEGYAGREAARAAEAAGQRHEQARTLLHFHLLLELVRQGEPPDPGRPPPERDSPANIEQRARAVLARLGRGNSLSPSAAVEALEELATAFAGCGLRHNPTGARLPLLCHEIAELAQAVTLWGEAGQDEERLCARLLVQAAQVTLRCARLALEAVHDLLLDLWSLLHRWRADPGVLLHRVERPEWMLDGWETICGLWRAAEPAGRRAAVLEMAALVPLIPDEARDWLGFDAPAEIDGARQGLRTWRRMVQAHQDWLSGRLLDPQLRYEAVRAVAA